MNASSAHGRAVARRARLVLLVLALLAPGVWAASVARLPAKDRAELLSTWQRRAGATGAVLGVVDAHGRWTGASGRVVRGGDPMSTSAEFRIASITKLFVATVVLQLVGEGRLRLDDPLSRWLPDFPRAQDITVRMLLDHSSGVPDYGQVEGFGRRLVEHRDEVWSTSRLLRVVARLKPEFPAGTSYEYSNTDYLLLGEVIRLSTGRTWAVEVHRRILGPLHLAHTYVAGVDPGPPVVPGYFDTDDDGTEENIEISPRWPAEESSEGPAGAIVSTVGDLLTFGDSLFHRRLVPASLLKEMVADRPHHSRLSNYGLGVEIERTDYETVSWGHGGFLPGFRSALRYYPGSDTLVVVLLDDSVANPDDLAELVWRADQLRVGSTG